MNSPLLIDAIRNNDDFKSIAQIINLSIGELKTYLINAIESSGESTALTDSDCDTDDDEGKDIYDRIIRDSLIAFSDEQLEFLRLAVKERKNILLAAPAGFGKSAVIGTAIELFHHILEQDSAEVFYERYGNFCNADDLELCSTFGLCASTGKAASLIKGRTLHSYLGIGVGAGSVSDWIKRVTTARYLKGTFNALRAVQVIIIDEISMISAQMLDNISEYLQRIRKNDAPFGGVQMIFIGDMGQLGPVQGTFMFKSKEYEAAKVCVHYLTKCFRQSDPKFLQALNEIRFGKCSDETFELLKSQTSIDDEYVKNKNIRPTKVMSTNKEVDEINERELLRICDKDRSKIFTFNVHITCSDKKKAEAYRKITGIPEFVKLAVGCQVVITYNLSNGIVNGTQGQIVSMSANEIKIMLTDGTIATISYIGFKDPEENNIYTAKNLFHYLPVRLGFALTVHKCQGMSLELLEADLKRTFAHGMAYTALSRCTDLRGLIVKNLSKKVFICDPAIKKFYGIQ